MRIVYRFRRMDRELVRAVAHTRRQAHADLADAILVAVSRHTSVELGAILGTGHGRYETYARHLVMFLWSDICRMGPKEIGRKLGRDHSTVIDGVRRISGEQRILVGTQNDVKAIRAMVAKERAA